MTKCFQVLLVVDVDGDVAVDELTALLPHEREERHVIRLTELGAPRLERRAPSPQPIDWPRIAIAVEAAATAVRRHAGGPLSLELYVGGFAPLPVFAHLGYALSKFSGAQTVLHRDFGGGAWRAYPITDSLEATAPRIFDAPSGMPAVASVTTAYVAVFVDLNGRAAPVDAIQKLHAQGGNPLGAVVELRTSAPVTLTPSSAGGLARELVQELGRVPSFFPHAAGTTLLLAVPAPVAFMAGRALNPTIFGSILLTNFFAGAYEFTQPLPFVDADAPKISRAPEDVAAREAVESKLKESLSNLQASLKIEDLPAELGVAFATKIVERLCGLVVAPSHAEEFGLSISEGTLTFGDGLLDALRGADDEKPQRFVQLLVLHELLHTEQGLRSTNYHDVGRAGVVLEQIDFAADVFALRVATALALRANPGAPPRDVAVPWFEAALFGIEVFDRRLDPVTMRELPERRLRRYLTWHLQLQRARTITAKPDVDRLLKSAIAAELAPLAAKLSPRHDKIVLQSVAETEFFCAVDGRLIRRAAQGVFDPKILVDAIRAYNHDVLARAMHAIVDENIPLLAPWRP